MSCLTARSTYSRGVNMKEFIKKWVLITTCRGDFDGELVSVCESGKWVTLKRKGQLLKMQVRNIIYITELETTRQDFGELMKENNIDPLRDKFLGSYDSRDEYARNVIEEDEGRVKTMELRNGRVHVFRER